MQRDLEPKCDFCQTRASESWVVVEMYVDDAISFEGDEEGSYAVGVSDGYPACFCSWAHAAVYATRLVADMQLSLEAEVDGRTKEKT